jgi:hypothetical protein
MDASSRSAANEWHRIEFDERYLLVIPGVATRRGRYGFSHAKARATFDCRYRGGVRLQQEVSIAVVMDDSMPNQRTAAICSRPRVDCVHICIALFVAPTAQLYPLADCERITAIDRRVSMDKFNTLVKGADAPADNAMPTTVRGSELKRRRLIAIFVENEPLVAGAG